MRSIGVPYADGYETTALKDLREQAQLIALDLQKAGIPVDANKEIIAMIAYMQRLGTDIKVKTQK